MLRIRPSTFENLTTSYLQSSRPYPGFLVPKHGLLVPDWGSVHHQYRAIAKITNLSHQLFTTKSSHLIQQKHAFAVQYSLSGMCSREWGIFSAYIALPFSIEPGNDTKLFSSLHTTHNCLCKV